MPPWLRRLLQIPDTHTRVPTSADLVYLPVGTHPNTGEPITLAESEMMREFIEIRTRAMEQEIRDYQALITRRDQARRQSDAG